LVIQFQFEIVSKTFCLFFLAFRTPFMINFKADQHDKPMPAQNTVGIQSRQPANSNSNIGSNELAGTTSGTIGFSLDFIQNTC
jgi:hypothetical protein